ARPSAPPSLTVPGHELHLDDSQFPARQLNEAERAFATELKLYPDSLEARTRFGAYYLATGRTSSFVELFTDLVRRAPTAENYAIAVRALKDAGEDEQARALERRKPRERRER